nr:hypothetical protein [Tanacetum cinerariifolium]
MLKQREQAANLAVQKEQEEQAVQSFTPYWNFSMIDNKEVLQAKEKLMKSIQTFLQKFSRYFFGVMPKVLSIAWERFSEIKHAFTDKQYQPEEIQELMCKLLEDVRNIREELAEYINSPSWNRPTFYDDDEEHSIQYKKYLENSSNAIAATNFNQEKDEPPQNSNIRQLIREECGIKVCEEQKQKMEDTMLELLEEVKNIVEQPTKRRTRITESLQNFRLIHKKSSISLNNTSQISSVNAIAPVLPTEEPKYSLSMGYEHLNTTLKMKSDEVIKSSAKNLIPIPNHSEILSDFNNDDISSDDDAFKDIEYVKETLPDYEFVSLEEENDDNPTPDRVLKSSSSIPIFEKSDHSLSYSDNSLPEFETFSDHTEETRSGSTTDHANNSHPEYDSFCFEIEPDQGRLTSIVKNDISNNSINDPLLEEVDLFLASDNLIPPGNENFDYDSEGDIHFLEELLGNDSIPLPENRSSNFDHHDDPSFPRPPPKPPDVKFFFDFEPNSKELISAMINNIDEHNEDECFDPGGDFDVFANIEDDDYFLFIFVIRIFLPYLIYLEVSPLLLSARSKDIIFDPGISV